MAAAMMGVIAFVRRQSLLGEVLSHASYPGVVIAFLLFATFFPSKEEWLWPVLLVGAVIFSLFGNVILHLLQERFKVNTDASLCIVLSSFLGVGVLLSSRVQSSYPKLTKEISNFLCGQAATMTDEHVYLYAALLCVVTLFIVCFFPQIRTIAFDPDFAKLSGFTFRWIQPILLILIVLAVVIGIQGVGVVLMAGMLIGPAVAARFLTNHLGWMVPIAALVGALSGLFGNVLSVHLSHQWKVSLPTGPMILTVATSIAFITALISPRGLLVRYSRIVRFRFRSLRENILKFLWKKGAVSFAEIQAAHHISPPSLWTLLQILRIEKSIDSRYRLLPKGKSRAEQIIRLHRLWELYLYRHMGIAGEKVHGVAEEMEHVITPEIEEELTELLGDPTLDPHNQPIPKRGKE